MAFSRASSPLRCTSHSSRDTTLGRLMVRSSPGGRPGTGVGLGAHSPTPDDAAGDAGRPQAEVLWATGVCVVLTTPPATSSVTANALTGADGLTVKATSRGWLPSRPND